MPPISPREIRCVIQQHFTELANDDREITSETLLVRGGEYCGHRYRTDDMAAIWFLEEHQIKFYSAAGRVLDTLDSTSLSKSQKDAA